MQIIVEGHKIDTKNIFSIEPTERRGYAGIVIRLIDKPSLVIEEYVDNLWDFKQSDAHERYRKLKKALIEKWEQDKSDLPVFKL